jgi:predicted amidohydrolase
LSWSCARIARASASGAPSASTTIASAGSSSAANCESTSPGFMKCPRRAASRAAIAAFVVRR